jgi:hypothetical protein
MKKVLFLFSLITLLTVSQHLSSQQLKKFSEDHNNFMSELYSFMEKNISAEDQKILNDFENVWEADSLFTSEEQDRIINISQKLLDKNAKPAPQFLNYLLSLLTFKKSNLGNENYNTWETGLIYIIEQRRVTLSKINAYLVFTIELINSNSLHKSPSTHWKASKPDYKFVFDEDIKLRFNLIDLTCITKRDSIIIFDTEGDYYPVDNIWKGKKGIVTWERSNYNKDEVFAVLPEYEIDMTKSEYQVENVTFTNKLYFDAPLKGTLFDKVKYIQKNESPTYPRFESYQKNFKIENLYDNINYEGGLAMHGAKLIGTGSGDELAKINIYRKDTLILEASSTYFGFRADRVSGPNTSVKIRLKKDSIYHPGLMFRYIVPTQELTLSRTEDFTTQSPYYDSYHNIDMSFEQLVWNMNEPFMKCTAPIGASIGKANFESANYFNYRNFIGMQGIDAVHPLISIRSFAKKSGSDEFTATDYANYLRKSITQVRQMLMRMSVLGFIFYDVNTEIAKLKPKLENFLAASVSKIDFDVIGFPSRTKAPLENAVFDLRNYDLKINGIPQIFVSDSQNVVFFPKGDRIILKRNRNFQFDGTVIAGLFTFYGNNFFFSYDLFKINLQNIDSLSIRYLTGETDNYGFPIIDKIDNQIQHITGEVHIDSSDNKSGRINYSEYPIFKSNENSYVYYDRKDIQNGVYEQDDFYFKLNPFIIDSLDNFNKKALKFDGEFYSAGIFPSFEQTISLQKDKSLGFLHLTPQDGFPLYGDKGYFKNEIHLSNDGLRGKGIITYLTSTAVSDDIIFFPDSLNAFVRDFTIDKETTGTQFPWVQSTNNYIHWLPYSDEFFVYKRETDFKLFNDSTTLSGSLKLEPTGLSGQGRMDLKNSEIKSNLFTYKSDEILADTADFYLKSLHTDGFTVLTDNVNAHIDYNSRKGYFNSNEDFTLVSFPENRYISYLNNFTWDMETREMAMGVTKEYQPEIIEYPGYEGELTGPRYISLHPDQDSLSFVSPLAYYDYKNNFIKATQVKYINVADGKIYPDEGNVVVEQDAKMRTLENATIITNNNTKYHTIHSAKVNIFSRNNYTGEGDYDYFDENAKKQIIHFNEIKVDENIQTIASGDIYEPDNFTLSPNYHYQGKVFLEADDRLLTFKGAVKIEHNCDILESKWLKFTETIDPYNIYIPVDEQTFDINRKRIFAGIFIHYDSVHVYPAFFTPKKFHSDNPIISAHGYLYYDKYSQLYKISSREKLYDRNLPGNYVSLHREDCQLYGEGKIDLGADLGLVKLISAGNARYYINDNKTRLNVLLGIDFFIDEEILGIIAREIDSIPDLPPTDMNAPTYNKGIIELAGRELAGLFKDELNLFGKVKEIPAPLKHTIFFNELKLMWDDNANSYRSYGKIGIGSINNTQINKRVDGLIEIQIKRSGDICDIYLEIDDMNWYYFGYTRGVMQTHSSNQEYVERIKFLKPKDRKQKVRTKAGGLSYIYMVSTERKKGRFYNRYLETKEQEEEKEQSNENQ